jgi:DNA-binding Lrp family transcriptional regulator
MYKYAILNQDNHQVLNTIVIENENILPSVLKEGEYSVPASRSVQIGMFYDPESKTFPDVFEQDRLLDLKEQIYDKINEYKESIEKYSILGEQELQVNYDYISELQTISVLETYDEMKSQFDSIGPEPEFPPLPKQITQNLFRSKLKLTEKIIWDNPESGTEIQKAIINTMKMEFPFYGVDSMNEFFTLLEENEIIIPERIVEIKSNLND